MIRVLSPLNLLVAGVVLAAAACSSGSSSSESGAAQAVPCDLDVEAVMLGREEPYRILVFGSLEPEINGEIAAFLNEQPDMYAIATSADMCVSPESLRHVNVVIDYDHDAIDPGGEEALRDFVLSGGKLIGLHHAIYDPLNVMLIKRQVYGAFLPSHCCHVEPEAYQVIMTAPDHPVLESLPAGGSVSYESPLVPAGSYPSYELGVLDERYTLIIFLEGSDVQILLSTTFEGVNYDIGWWRQDGPGVVFYFQMGHLQEMFTEPWYRQLIINAVRFQPGD